MVAAKDNFLGKYIYKDTLARNLAAVIYRVSSFSNYFCCELSSSFVFEEIPSQFMISPSFFSSLIAVAKASFIFALQGLAFDAGFFFL